MKKILLSFSGLITSVFLYAQTTTFQWAKSMTGYTGAAIGQDIAVDNSKNVYTIGNFSGRVDFDPGAGIFNLTSAGNEDIFISKSDSSGNFIWAKQLGGTSYEYGYSIAVDGSGNVYTTGKFIGTADFDPDLSGNYNLTPAGSYDIFISKLGASGNFIWAKQLGGTLQDYSYSIAVDGSGNVYTTGYFNGTADFDPDLSGIFNLTSAGSSDIFISKLNGSGNFLWAKQLGGTSGDLGNSITADALGNIYTTGYFYGTADFDPDLSGTFNLTSAGYSDIFISKLDASGNFVWAKQLGGTSDDLGSSIALDGSGNIYTTGYFKGTADFDPDVPGTFNLAAAGIFGYADIFISKLNASGNFVWAKKMGADYTDQGFSITVNGSGDVFTIGHFGVTTDFDPGPGTFNLTAVGSFGYPDIFISKLDASGNFIWAKQLGGSYEDKGYSIAVDGSGNVFTTGYFNGIADFNPDVSGIFNLAAYGINFAFFSKLNSSGSFVWAKSAGVGIGSFGKSIATDLTGNVYTTGYFYGTIDFDPDVSGIFNLATNANDYWGDIFISKLDASGNFVWAKQLGGISDDRGYSVTVDGSGNVYTTGYFSGTADFDPGAGTFNLTSAGGYDIFILKLDVSGNFVWAKQFGGSSEDIGNSIAADGSGNVYTTGYFQGTADFDPGVGAFNLTAVGNKDIFISKLNASGNFVWAKQSGGTSSDVATSLTVNGSGNVYITGSFSGTADFDPGAATFNLTGGGGFVSELDAFGNFVMAKAIGGASNSITLDASENIYTTGYFQGTVDFDPGTGIFNLTAAGHFDIFITKSDFSGNFVWAKQLRGTDYEYGYSIAVDGSGNVYTTGNFQGTVDFDPDVSGTFNLTAPGSGYPDIFISKLNASGNFVWAKQLRGTDSDFGYSIKVDGSDNIYTTGNFYGTNDFDPDAGTFYLTASGTPDFFVHKMSQCTMPSATITPSGPTTFCNGGNVNLSANSGTGFSYQWKVNGADISGATNQAYNATLSGSYSVVVTNACGAATSSAVAITVNSLPSATITPAGPTTFCSGGSVVLNAVVAANRTYQWKKNGMDIAGATLASYTATTGGTYKVTVTNTVTGCSKTSAAGTKVIVNAKPASTITPQGPTTFCAGGSVVLAANIGTGLTYKWKKASNYISGATLSNYTATAAGTYRVEVTNSNGCSKLSAGVTITVPCKEGEAVLSENNFDVKVFPNPSPGDFTFEIVRKDSFGENAEAQEISISVYDVIGKMVLNGSSTNSQFTIHDSQLKAGIYAAEIICGKSKKVLKLIKID